MSYLSLVVLLFLLTPSLSWTSRKAADDDDVARRNRSTASELPSGPASANIGSQGGGLPGEGGNAPLFLEGDDFDERSTLHDRVYGTTATVIARTVQDADEKAEVSLPPEQDISDDFEDDGEFGFTTAQPHHFIAPDATDKVILEMQERYQVKYFRMTQQQYERNYRSILRQRARTRSDLTFPAWKGHHDDWLSDRFAERTLHWNIHDPGWYRANRSEARVARRDNPRLRSTPEEDDSISHHEESFVGLTSAEIDAARDYHSSQQDGNRRHQSHTERPKLRPNTPGGVRYCDGFLQVGFSTSASSRRTLDPRRLTLELNEDDLGGANRQRCLIHMNSKEFLGLIHIDFNRSAECHSPSSLVFVVGLEGPSSGVFQNEWVRTYYHVEFASGFRMAEFIMGLEVSLKLAEMLSRHEAGEENVMKDRLRMGDHEDDDPVEAEGEGDEEGFVVVPKMRITMAREEEEEEEEEEEGETGRLLGQVITIVEKELVTTTENSSIRLALSTMEGLSPILDDHSEAPPKVAILLAEIMRWRIRFASNAMRKWIHDHKLKKLQVREAESSADPNDETESLLAHTGSNMKQMEWLERWGLFDEPERMMWETDRKRTLTEGDQIWERPWPEWSFAHFTDFLQRVLVQGRGSNDEESWEGKHCETLHHRFARLPDSIADLNKKMFQEYNPSGGSIWRRDRPRKKNSLLHLFQRYFDSPDFAPEDWRDALESSLRLGAQLSPDPTLVAIGNFMNHRYLSPERLALFDALVDLRENDGYFPYAKHAVLLIKQDSLATDKKFNLSLSRNDPSNSKYWDWKLIRDEILFMSSFNQTIDQFKSLEASAIRKAQQQGQAALLRYFEFSESHLSVNSVDWDFSTYLLKLETFEKEKRRLMKNRLEELKTHRFAQTLMIPDEDDEDKTEQITRLVEQIEAIDLQIAEAEERDANDEIEQLELQQDELNEQLDLLQEDNDDDNGGSSPTPAVESVPVDNSLSTQILSLEEQIEVLDARIDILEKGIGTSADSKRWKKLQRDLLPRLVEAQLNRISGGLGGRILKIPVKLCVARLQSMSDESQAASLSQRFLVGFGKTLGLRGVKWGLTHAYPILKNVSIHWGVRGLVGYKHDSENPYSDLEVLCVDTSAPLICNFQLLQNAVGRIAQYIVRANATMSYRAAGTENVLFSAPGVKRNCQTFSEDILSALGAISMPKLMDDMYGAVAVGIMKGRKEKQIRQFWHSKIQVVSDSSNATFQSVFSRAFEALAKLQQEEGAHSPSPNQYVVFGSHYEVNVFQEELIKVCREFPRRYFHAWMLLKGMCRSFLKRGDRVRRCMSNLVDAAGYRGGGGS